MPRRKYTVALILPAQSAYSRALTEGVVERHLDHQDWTIIELPRLGIGQSPLPKGSLQLDGAITWAEPRDLWMRDLLANGVRVVNCGTEWAGVAGVASVHFRFSDLHQQVLQHFTKLGLQQTVAIGHRLKQRPATAGVLAAYQQAAETARLKAKVWSLEGAESPSSSPQRLLNPQNEAELAAFLKSLKPPVGIYCTGDHIGFIVCEVAARLGLRVPEDLAVVGQGDNLVARFAQPPLSSVVGPAREVGLAAADCLAEWLTTGKQPTETIEIYGASLIKRESTLGRSGSVALEAVRSFIARRAIRGVSLGELTDLSGMEVKTLNRRYRSAFGIDPLNEVHALRIAAAKRLLSTPRMTILNVALSCGFSSQASFYNYFKRHTGVGPGAYRTALPNRTPHDPDPEID